MKLQDICTFKPKSKRHASFGEKIGTYPFYTSSKDLTKYCNEADYTDECIIIGTGGNANIKINKKFSCSADNFIICANKICLNKYIYYYLLKNINKLQDCFHGATIEHLSKRDLEMIEIPIPSIKKQLEIIEKMDEIYNKIEENNKMNQMLLEKDIISQILENEDDIDQIIEPVKMAENTIRKKKGSKKQRKAYSVII
jgi:type I restriction enzyme S subunit